MVVIPKDFVEIKYSLFQDVVDEFSFYLNKTFSLDIRGEIKLDHFSPKWDNTCTKYVLISVYNIFCLGDPEYTEN